LLADERLPRGKYLVAISFCHSKDAVDIVNHYFKIPLKNIIPKIEAVLDENVLRQIIHGVDFAMLGRGDLSLSTSSEKMVPVSTEIHRYLLQRECHANNWNGHFRKFIGNV
jgi:pyruvate kinase